MRANIQIEKVALYRGIECQSIVTAGRLSMPTVGCHTDGRMIVVVGRVWGRSPLTTPTFSVALEAKSIVTYSYF